MALSANKMLHLIGLPDHVLQRILGELSTRDFYQMLFVPNFRLKEQSVSYLIHVHQVWLRSLYWLNANSDYRKRVSSGQYFSPLLQNIQGMLAKTGEPRVRTESVIHYVAIEFGPLQRLYSHDKGPNAHLRSGELIERLTALMAAGKLTPLTDQQLRDYLSYVMVLLDFLSDVSIPSEAYANDIGLLAGDPMSHCKRLFATFGDYSATLSRSMTDYVEKTVQLGRHVAGLDQDTLLRRCFTETQVHRRLRASLTVANFDCTDSTLMVEQVLPHFVRLQRLNVFNVDKIDFKRITHYLGKAPSIKHLFLRGRSPELEPRPDTIEYSVVPLDAMYNLDVLQVQDMAWLDLDAIFFLLVRGVKTHLMTFYNNAVSASHLQQVVEHFNKKTNRNIIMSTVYVNRSMYQRYLEEQENAMDEEDSEEPAAPPLNVRDFAKQFAPRLNPILEAIQKKINANRQNENAAPNDADAASAQVNADADADAPADAPGHTDAAAAPADAPDHTDAAAAPADAPGYADAATAPADAPDHTDAAAAPADAPGYADAATVPADAPANEPTATAEQTDNAANAANALSTNAKPSRRSRDSKNRADKRNAVTHPYTVTITATLATATLSQQVFQKGSINDTPGGHSISGFTPFALFY